MSAPAHRARKRFSQNFLHDPRVIARIVGAIDPRPGDRIIEIGPGQAALTRPLVARAGHIRCVEIDRDLAAALREQFSVEELTLIEGDALKLDWSDLARSGAALKVVGNLPYHISTELLFALLPIADRVVAQHFMLQKEVVDRMVAAPGSKTYGRLSVMLQARYAMHKLFDVPRGAFQPPPQVTSSIVRMRPWPHDQLAAVDADVFARLVTAAFGQRRKTLRNALHALLSAEVIEATGVDPGARAETLSVMQFVALAQAAARAGATSPASGATAPNS